MDPTLTLGTELRDRGEHPPVEVPALVLLGSSDEPHRTGDVVLLPASLPKGVTALLGRAPPATETGVHRLGWVRQRPGGNLPAPPLASPRVSRDQLRLEPRPDGTLRVENVGRCPLRVNGAEVREADVRPGDRLELQQQVLLLVTRRHTLLDDLAHAPEIRHRFGEPDAFGMVGESPAIWALRDRIAFAARRIGHVLVRGPSGSGKELVAQALHAASSRAKGPLVARNAATLPESLVDAELFGNARNYPNPGMPERAGMIGEADGGTLFLDELGELPEALQAHLLRVLDAGEYTRLGEGRSRRSDFRLVGATNRDEESLKHDVLARLRLRIEVPGLDRRLEDVPMVAAHLLRRMARADAEIAARFFPGGDPDRPPRLALRTLDLLVSRPTTTHVRELELRLLECMAESRGDTIVPSGALLEPSDPAPAPEGPPPTDPSSLDPEEIQAVLDRHGGRQEPAWRELGLSSRHVLTRLVRRYDLDVRGRSSKDG